MQEPRSPPTDRDTLEEGQGEQDRELVLAIVAAKPAPAAVVADTAVPAVRDPTAFRVQLTDLLHSRHPWVQDAQYVTNGSPAGGAIELIVSGTTTINGNLSANGIGSNSAGASGGSIWIQTGILTGSGTISATGSNAQNCGGCGSGGAGGGGRIALYYTTDAFSGTVTVAGGAAYGSGAAGGAGSIFSENIYTVTPSVGTGGSISPNTAQTLNSGSTTTFTVTANTGYSISSVTGCGGTLSGNTYTTGAITSNCTVAATFTLNAYTITTSGGTNGSISPSGTTTVNSGGSQTYTITPATGYSVSSVLVDGTSVGPVSTYTFSNVTANHTISATFAINTYTITASSGTNGSVIPSGATIVNYGSSHIYAVTPNTGYSVSGVTVDGSSVGAVTFYTFSNVTANHAISATFAINTYTVTPTAGTGGSISPSTPQTVNYNATTSFTVTPNTGYSISSVTGCGGTLSGDTYTTGAITSSCSVAATFTLNTYPITTSVGTNGSIAPSGVTTVNYGGSQTYTITPNTGYYIADVLLDGISQGAVSQLTLNNITSAHTISATFALSSYTVTASAGANGSISPSGANTVSYGNAASFAITPNTGYSISTVSGCGGSLIGNIYTTGAVTADCSVSVLFSLNTYTVTVTQAQNGTISPSTSTANYGDNLTLTLTPDPSLSCYQRSCRWS